MIRKYIHYENYEDHRINKDRINDLLQLQMFGIFIELIIQS